MRMVTSEGVAGHRVVESLGLVRGSAVRTRHVGADVVAAMRNLVGGEVLEYAALLDQAREQALARLADEAGALGADGVVALRLQTSAIADRVSEVIAYGTAVRLERT
mgnify:CR=1 FL=1